ncbi:MAG: hypothetical protein H6815_06310 [Phycisphaeraceae bacterium]|nr:hypothetical protein [Phycisphaerales bacterium]MCB9860052.1 hypothetical protein [Phycisphaeraceae bacterium]
MANHSRSHDFDDNPFEDIDFPEEMFQDGSKAGEPSGMPGVPFVPSAKGGTRGGDRRKNRSGASPTGLERRRGPGRRLSDFARAAEEGDLTKEQFLFVVAMDEFKKANNVTFPSWCDVVEVMRLLGYRKVQKSELSLPRAEDWRERPDAPSNVRTDRQRQRDEQARNNDQPNNKAA